MKTRQQLVTAGVAVYELVIGLVLTVVGIRSQSWWTSVVGIGMFVLGVGTGFGRGESTSWLRGDFDERRRSAVDHAFRIAFLALAWWVAGVAFYASRHSAAPEVYGAGNGIALVVAYVDYALVLRRS